LFFKANRLKSLAKVHKKNEKIKFSLSFIKNPVFYPSIGYNFTNRGFVKFHPMYLLVKALIARLSKSSGMTSPNERFRKIAALPSWEKKVIFARWLLRWEVSESRNFAKPLARCMPYADSALSKRGLRNFLTQLQKKK